MAVTPTTNKLLLRHTVRRYRELAKLTQEQLGERAFPHLKATDARNKINLIEQGQRVPQRASDLTAIIDVLSTALEQAGHSAVDKATTQDMEWMRKNASQRGRWTGAKAVFGEDVRKLIDLEEDADLIRLCGSELVPGPLQCDEYAQALFATNKERSSEDVAASVQARLSLVDIFTRKEHRTQLNAVLSESCLLRIPGVGTQRTLLRQLDHMIQLSERENITIQIIPFLAPSTNSFVVRPTEFLLLRIPAPGLAGPLDLGYTEAGFEARIIEDKPGVAAFETAWAALTAVALSPHDSLRFMDNLKIQFR
jgi:transcriptional regulator with XRE-family HTH domain